MWCGAVRPGCRGKAVKVRCGVEGYRKASLGVETQGSQGPVRRVADGHVGLSQVKAVWSGWGCVCLVMSSHGKAVAEWSGWHVPSGPGPVLQGSQGASRNGVEGSVQSSCREAWQSRSGIFRHVVARRLTQGSLGTARRGWLGYRNARRSGRVRSGLCLARQVGLAQRSHGAARMVRHVRVR